MTLVEIAKGQNGYVSASQATAAGIPRRKLAEAVGKGELVQVERGLYALPETWRTPTSSLSIGSLAASSPMTRHCSCTA